MSGFGSVGKSAMRLSYLIANADASMVQLTDDSLLAQLLSIDGHVSDFNDNTDSLEALSDAIAAISTSSPALASVLGALADVAATGAVSEAKTAMSMIKQLVTMLLDGTYGLGALDADLTTIINDLANGTDGLSALKALTDRNVGPSTSGMAVTQTLYVSTIGTGADGLSWDTAYNTINEALDAASMDAGDCTLILIGPNVTAYDIDATGDPTWAANVILMGAYRTWTRVVNTHETATSILKLTGKSGVVNMNFDLCSACDGLIMSSSGFFVNGCFFTGTALTSAATALDLIGAAQILNGRVIDSEFIGHVGRMTAIKLTKIAHSVFRDLRIHDCLTGIHITDAESDANMFREIAFGDNATAVTIDAGDEQDFIDLLFHGNTMNFSVTGGAHTFSDLDGPFQITTHPNDLDGTEVPSHADAATWGDDTELRAAVAATKPFKVIGVVATPSVVETFRLRMSADSGSTFFEDIIVTAAKASSMATPSGTGYIFNAGTRISGSCQNENGGDHLDVFLKIQEI